MNTIYPLARFNLHKTVPPWLAGLLLLGAVGWPAAPPSQSKNDLAISLLARKVVLQPGGQEKLEPAERAFPGEVIQYDALYQNQGDQPIRRVEPTLPIPEGMVYVPGSAQPPPNKASLDGKNFHPIPLHRKVTLPNGTIEDRVVPPTDYRALRWSVGDMKPGAKTTVIARTKLIPANPPANPPKPNQTPG